MGAVAGPRRFFARAEERVDYARGLKTRACPWCGAVGFLICHGLLKGYAPSGNEAQVRGFRFYCSQRRRNGGGCGRTYSILLSNVLPRRCLRAPQLWDYLKRVLRGLSRRAAWRRAGAGFSGFYGYRLWAGLMARQAEIRQPLWRLAPAPPCRRSDPLIQMLRHLKCAFPGQPCPITAWQETFQSAFPL